MAETYEEKLKSRKPIFEPTHESVDQVEQDMLGIPEQAAFQSLGAISENIFASTFMREQDSGVLPAVSRDYQQKELTEPILDTTGSKSERKRKKTEYEVQKAEYDRIVAIQAQERDYYKTATNIVGNTVVQTRGNDVYDIQHPWQLEEFKDDEVERPFEWIKMKFTNLEEDASEEDKDAFYVQDRIAKSMTEARNIMMKEKGKPAPDLDRLETYDKLSQRLVLCSNSYVLNERDIKSLNKLKKDGLAGVKAQIDAGTQTEDIDTDAVLGAVIEKQAAVQKTTRQNLQLEIRKLTALIRRAELVTVDESTWAEGEDLVYLEQIGVSSAIFNMLGWPYEARRDSSVKTQAEFEEKYGSRMNMETDSDRQKFEDGFGLDDDSNPEIANTATYKEQDKKEQATRKRKAHDEIITKELGAEYDRYDPTGLIEQIRRNQEEAAARLSKEEDEQWWKEFLENEKKLKEAESKENEDAKKRRFADFRDKLDDERLAEEARLAAEKLAQDRIDFKALIATEFVKEKSAEAHIEYLASSMENELVDDDLKTFIEEKIDRAIEADTDKVVEAMNATAQRAVERIGEINANLDLKLSPQERMFYMAQLDETLVILGASLETLSPAGQEITEKEAPQTTFKQEKLTKLTQGRINAYSARIKQLTEIQSQYALAKYHRAIKRRTNIDRVVPHTAQELENKILDRATLTKTDLDTLRQVLQSEQEPTKEQRAGLLENLDAFLTGKMKREVGGSLAKLSSEELLNKQDRKLLHAATMYILSIEDRKAIEPEFEKASIEALSDLAGDLEGLLLTDGVQSLEGDKKTLRALTIGQELDTLRSQAQRALTKEAREVFDAEYSKVQESYAVFMENTILAENHDEMLRKVLGAGALHPGLLQEYSKLSTDEAKKFIDAVKASGAEGAAAIDTLLKSRPDLDGLALLLKTRALEGTFAGEAHELSLKERANIMTAHDGSRLARTCRNSAIEMLTKEYQGDQLELRISDVNKLDDKAMIASLLDKNPAGDNAFLLIVTYALLLSGETGLPITESPETNGISVKYLKENVGVFRKIKPDTIKTALTTKMGSASQYEDMSKLIISESSIYDSNSRGNKFLNYLGGIFGKDFSTESMGLWVLNSLTEASGHYDAKAIQQSIIRELRGTTMGGSMTTVGSEDLEQMVESIKDSSSKGPKFVKDLALAGQRFESRKLIEGFQEGRHAAEHEVYSEEMFGGISSVSEARRTLESKAKETKKDFTVSNATSLALGVLSANALMGHLKNLVTAPMPISEKQFIEDLEHYKAAAKAIRSAIEKGAGGQFDLRAMSSDNERREGEDTHKERRRFKDPIEALEKAATIADVNAVIGAFESTQNDLNLVQRAQAALLLEKEAGHIEAKVKVGTAEEQGGMDKLIDDFLSGVGGGILEKTKAKRADIRNILMDSVKSSTMPVQLNYEAAMAVRKRVEQEMSGSELLLAARADRIDMYGGNAEKNEEGATLSLTVLAVSELSNIISARHSISGGNIKRYKKYFSTLKGKLSGNFNLEAMTKDGLFNRQSETQVGAVREEYMSLIKACAEAPEDDNAVALVQAVSNLKAFYAAHRLEERAVAALSAKGGTQSFETKLQNATDSTTFSEAAVKTAETEKKAAEAAAEAAQKKAKEEKEALDKAMKKGGIAAVRDLLEAQQEVQATIPAVEATLPVADNTMEKIQASLLGKYKSELSRKTLDRKDPLRDMDGKLKVQLKKVTEAAVLASFQETVGLDFSTFMERLSDHGSPEFQALNEKLGIAFTNLHFMSGGEEQHPLDAGWEAPTAEEAAKTKKDSARGIKAPKALRSATTKGLLLAEAMMEELSTEITSNGKTSANEWLVKTAHKGTSEQSIMFQQARKKVSVTAADALKRTLTDMTVEKMIGELSKGEVLSIQSYKGGNVGLKGAVSSIEASVNLESIAANDLTISKEDDNKLSVYIGGSMFNKLSATAGTDLGVVKLEGSAELSLTLAKGMKLDFSTPEKCQDFLTRVFMGGYGTNDEQKSEDATAKELERERATHMLELADRIAPVRSIAGKIGIGASVGTSDDANSIMGDEVAKLVESTKVGEYLQRGVSASKEFAGSRAESLSKIVQGWAMGSYGYMAPRFVDFAADVLSHAPSTMSSEWESKLNDAYKELNENIEKIVKEKLGKQIDDLPKTIADKLTDKMKAKLSEALVKHLNFEAPEEEDDGLIDKAVAKLTSVAGEKIDEKWMSADELEEAKKTAEEEEEAQENLIDAKLAVKMSMAGAYDTEVDKDSEKITTKVSLDASAEGNIDIAGASLSKKAEGRFEASLERRFKGGKLTGATMSRRYILGENDWKSAKEILDGFGVKNRAILDDIRGELAGLSGLVLIFDAELTEAGMKKYQEARETGMGLTDIFCLNDRKNYRSTLVKLEVPVSAASQRAALQVDLNLKAMGSGGGVNAGISSGTDGTLKQWYKYNARNVKGV